MNVRCVQCGWTIAPDRFEDLWLNDQRVPLHRGGCPEAKPKEKWLPHPMEWSRG